MMIGYSTEARGYSLAIASALSAQLVCERALERASWPAIVGFWAVVSVGFLSHFSFGHAYFALAVWSAWRLARSPQGWRSGALRFAQLHAVPIAWAVALYLIFVRDMRVGGGPQLTVVEVLSRTLAWTLGGPVQTGVALALAVVVVAVTVANVVGHRRSASDRWVFDVAAVVVAPILTIVILQPEPLAPRYFLMSITFFLLTLAHVLSRILMTGRIGMVVGVILLSLYLAGNTAHLIPFLRLGRGEFEAAIRYMATTSGSGCIGGTSAPVLGTSSLRSSTPSAGAGSPFNSIFFLSSAIGSHLIALL